MITKFIDILSKFTYVIKHPSLIDIVYRCGLYECSPYKMSARL